MLCVLVLDVWRDLRYTLQYGWHGASVYACSKRKGGKKLLLGFLIFHAEVRVISLCYDLLINFKINEQ